jgi:hypothetical protein
MRDTFPGECMLDSNEWRLQVKLQCDTQQPLKRAQGDQIRLEKKTKMMEWSHVRYVPRRLYAGF